MQPDDSIDPKVVLEPYAGKLARTVLRGGCGSDGASLPSCWMCNAMRLANARTEFSPLSTYRDEGDDDARPLSAAVRQGRRGFVQTVAAAGATAVAASAAPSLLGWGQAYAQVDVGSASSLRKLVPAGQLEEAAAGQYQQMLAQARAKNALVPDDHPQLQALRGMARKLIPYTQPWNSRAKNWRWEVNLIASKQINAFCMPGGKIAFYTGILNELKLSRDEAALSNEV